MDALHSKLKTIENVLENCAVHDPKGLRKIPVYLLFYKSIYKGSKSWTDYIIKCLHTVA